MYTTSGTPVRERWAAYGPHEAGGDEYPAGSVLDDLASTADPGIPWILARYAVLRSWVLRQERADPALVSHALLAARAYMSAVEDGPAADALAHLLGPRPEIDGFGRAAADARASDHVEGACALLRAGYLTARRRGDLPGAARMAGSLADLLDARGLDGGALWARRAERLRARLRDR